MMAVMMAVMTMTWMDAALAELQLQQQQQSQSRHSRQLKRHGLWLLSPSNLPKETVLARLFASLHAAVLRLRRTLRAAAAEMLASSWRLR